MEQGSERAADERSPGAMTRWARRVVDADAFESAVLALLIANLGLLSFEVKWLAEYDQELWWFYSISTVGFVVELLLRFVAHGPRYGAFFRDRWNVVDVVVIALSLLPVVGAFGVLGRFARFGRLLQFVRVARIFTVMRPRPPRGGPP